MQSLRTVIDNNPGIFGQGDDRATDEAGRNQEGTAQGELVKMYGWIVWLDTLSEGDYTKWRYFEKLKAEQLLPIIRYHITKVQQINLENQMKSKIR